MENNPTGRDDDYKHKWTKHQHIQFHKANTTGHKNIDKPQDNDSG
jgi:hypothetical protein